MNYDVVIIGAGNGGLVAACTASSMGLKTLLIEQHNLPGGLATSFVRGRFEFEPSLHALGLGVKENPGSLCSLFERLGVDVNWCDIPEAFRLIITNPDEKEDVTLPNGIKEIIDTVENAVPGSRTSVLQFIQICKDVVEGFEYLGKSQGNPDPEILMRDYGNLLRTSGVAVEDVESFLNMPQKARNILNAYWSYLGVDSANLDFQMYALIIFGTFTFGGVVPKMRSHEIAVALDVKIRENGGTILYNTKVSQVNVQNRRVTGVTLESGETIPASHVISDVTQHVMFSQLLKPESAIPAMQLKMANSRGRFYTGTMIYLGLNKSREELGIKEYENFIYPTGDSSVLCKDRSSINKSKAQLTVCLNAAVPGCSPAGTSILYLLVLSDEKAWANVTQEEYFKLKNQIAKEAISYYEESTNIKISDCIEEIEVATPVTYARFTGNYNGEVLGYLSTAWDNMLVRTMTDYLDNDIQGLRFCGKGKMGGYRSTLASGETAALQTIQDIKEYAK